MKKQSLSILSNVSPVHLGILSWSWKPNVSFTSWEPTQVDVHLQRRDLQLVLQQGLLHEHLQKGSGLNKEIYQMFDPYKYYFYVSI